MLQTPYVKDQLSLPSCAACAVATAYEMMGGGYEASPLFIWHHMEQMREGTAPLSVQTALAVIRRYGVCSESSWPYDVKKASQKPPELAYREARRHKIHTTIPSNTLEEQIRSLQLQRPLLLSYDVSLLRDLGLPVKDGPSLHVSVMYGYLPESSFVVRNSWGNKWNSGGDFILPSSLLQGHPAYLGCVAVVR